MSTRKAFFLSLLLALPLCGLAKPQSDCEVLYLKDPGKDSEKLAEFIAMAYQQWRSQNPDMSPKDCYTVELVDDQEMDKIPVQESDKAWIAWPIGF